MSEEMAQTPLQESGYLLKVDLRYPPIWRPRPSISRTIRVPKQITFHQLNAILVRALGWSALYRERKIWGSDKEYEFVLWEKELNMLDFTTEPKEILVADHTNHRHFAKSSKTRRLVQVFGTSRIWPEVPNRINYEMQFGEDAEAWEYCIEFLGETDLTLDDRPGQEAFCLEGTGCPEASDLEDGLDLAELDQRRDVFDVDHVNGVLEAWCHYWRMSKFKGVH